jgi:hypothetical protein
LAGKSDDVIARYKAICDFFVLSYDEGIFDFFFISVKGEIICSPSSTNAPTIDVFMSIEHGVKVRKIGFLRFGANF